LLNARKKADFYENPPTFVPKEFGKQTASKQDILFNFTTHEKWTTMWLIFTTDGILPSPVIKI
jgi:hypothetical protein